MRASLRDRFRMPASLSTGIKPRWLIALGVVVFLITLVLHAPAALLYAKFAPQGGQVSLVGISGSISRGSASMLVVRGQPALRELNWDLQAWKLLLARVSLKLSAKGDLPFSGRLSLHPTGIDLYDVEATGGIKPLAALAGQAFVPVDGRFTLALDRLALRKGFPQRGEGRLTVQGLAYTLPRDPVGLGDFQADLGPGEAGALLLKISTLAGSLDAHGDGHLRPDRSYDLDLLVKSKGGGNPMVGNMLRGMGRADKDGYHHIRQQGQLPPSPGGPVGPGSSGPNSAVPPGMPVGDGGMPQAPPPPPAPSGDNSS